MADSAHLEKMGRELKCPICLSLLNSAVSLTCNHAFCNSCISKSMKSASNCPVCKVPYRRREVRAAPHMDNLVSIYKSMELASGINIFLTQNAPSAKKTEDGQIQGEGGSNPGGTKSDKTCNEKAVKRNSLKRKGLKEMESTKITLSDPHPSPKPSFPAKKRVRVPQCILSETPTRPEKVSNLINQSGKFEAERSSNKTAGSSSQKDCSTVLKEKPAFDDKGEPVFKPFFWLRERDDDDDEEVSEYLSAEQMEGDCLTGTLPGNAPCFSGIKDSDDGSPIKMAPTGEGCSKPKATDIFDSEMFEWTQIACSPELSSTPMKRQKECEPATEIDTAFRNKAVVSRCLKGPNEEQGNENTNMGSPLLPSNQNKNAKNTRKKTVRKHKRPNRKVQSKGAKSSAGRSATVSDEIVGEVPISPIKVAEIFNQGNECAESAKAINSERKYSGKHKKGKRVKVSMNQFVVTCADEELQEAPMKSSEVKGQNQGKENEGMTMMELPILSCQQTENDKSLDEKNKISKLKMRRCVRQSKKPYIRMSTAIVLKEISNTRDERTKNQGSNNMNMELPVLPGPQIENDKTLESGKKTGSRVKKMSHSQYKRNNTRESKEPKRNNCTADATRYEAIDGVLLDTNRSADKENLIISKHQEDAEFGEDNNSAKDKILPTAKDHNPQKCENVPNQIRCAFCQSGNDSEASGEMLHYFEGKPVAADYNSGSNIIHSHRNCTEWAPNVYFEDDTVINLEIEIARSRRIKCSCCGIKGASLGCYEKSCRKSFHVPCAKMVSQCRWDTENFVMLCPLHSSSKLPKEITGCQQKSRNRSTQNMNLQAHAAVHPGMQRSGNWKWPSALPSKWVICCSALTFAEKEIVSNFTRLVSVPISKNWSPSVTHVIASIDENGACKRTLKILMGILEGKWILKIDWIKACMAAMEPINEEQYEISTDVHGINNGPQFGRLRVMNKEPKVFNGITIYFVGDFVPTYKGYLQNLVVAGGGIVLQRKPISRDQERLLNESFASTTILIYSLELPEKCNSRKKDLILNCRRAEAHTLANAIGAKVAGHSWILDSIAACKLQMLA